MRTINILLSLLVFGIGCEVVVDEKNASEDAGSDETDAGAHSVLGAQTKSTIDKSGGEMQLGEMTLTVPEGALNDSIELGIKAVEPPVPIPEEYVQVSDVFECTPHGIKFDKPIQMEISYASESQRPHYVLRLDDRKDTSWSTIEFTSAKAGVASWEVEQFSFFVVVYEIERALSKPDASMDSAVEADSGVGGSGGSGGSIEILCGNGVIEGEEQCDDGNFDQRDGCTTLCEFSCETDSDCDDMNSCNGNEVCDEETHACDDSDESLEDGASCGASKSCWRGICVDDICGDGKVNDLEECDDGNLDPDDGCTPDCEFTCEDNSDCSGQDECLGDRVCEYHMCVGGEKLDDETPCEIKDARTKSFCGDADVDKDGWCMNGVCTCTDCGDGQVSGIEECDDGDLNGTSESSNNCSVNCRIVACRNGFVEGDEECDDGNDNALDGCDPDCRVEIFYRVSSAEIMRQSSTEFCRHQHNRLGEAFITGIELSQYGLENTYLSNEYREEKRDDGSENWLFQLSKMDDPSTRTSDDDILIGIYSGVAESAWQEGPPLDFPFLLESSDVEDDLPVWSVPAELSGAGRITSKEPTDVQIPFFGGRILMRDAMFLTILDMQNLSVPSSPPDIADTVKIPETAGWVYPPQGILCGAISSLHNIPLSSQIADVCCNKYGEKYRGCADGEEPGVDCATLADLLEGGCSVFFALPSGTCGDPETDLRRWIVYPVQADVDTDDDGENDSFSAAFAFEATRVRVAGTTNN
jgi:cysteine-rich repeat protein